MISKKNVICNILLKDMDGNYRKIFTVEGDDQKDQSIYFYEWSSKLNNLNKRHYSYHSKKDINGFVRTHISDIKHLSKRQQAPLNQRKKVICSFHYQNDRKLNDFPFSIPEKTDVYLTIRSEYFGYCEYVFYVNEEGLTEYSTQKSLIVLHKYALPVKHLKQLHFAVLIQEKVLTVIQSE